MRHRETYVINVRAHDLTKGYEHSAYTLHAVTSLHLGVRRGGGGGCPDTTQLEHLEACHSVSLRAAAPLHLATRPITDTGARK